MDKNSMSTDDESESSSDEWEEVPNAEEDEVAYITARQNQDAFQDTYSGGSGNADSVPVLPKEGLKITLPNPNGINFKKKKKGSEIIGNYIVREINKCKREIYKDIHRVYLLSHFGRNRIINAIINSESILKTALSILPPDKRSYPAKNLDLNYIEKFIKWYKGTYTLQKSEDSTNNFYPPISTLTQELEEQIKSRKIQSYSFQTFIFIIILRAMGIQVRLVCNLDPPSMRPPSSDLMKLIKSEEENNGPQPSTSTAPQTNPTQKSSKKASKPPPKKVKTEELEVTLSDMDISTSSSDSEPKRKKGKKSKAKMKSKSPRKRNSGRKLISSDEDEGDKKVAPTPPPTTKDKQVGRKSKSPTQINMWAEVYLEEEEQWISVDILDGKLLSESTIVAKASQPISYVISYSGTGGVKDVTARYSTSLWSDIGKSRDDEWWMKSIRCYYDRKSRIDREEDESLRQSLLTQPIPNTISALKNHPLYALRRHLLKFEGIYPPDIIPCGYLKDEPVYPRSSVHTLNGRETWLRKARVVRIGEKAYKTVKARPKYSRNIGMVVRDEPLELFGKWQTEEYEPPIVVDGKVPRNEFGNVYVYTPKMLPIGTVLLDLPGLNRVARKLDIDCVPAVVGFEFHSGGCHPKFGGFVVCEEFKDIIEDAWTQEQEEIEKRGEERRLKRIYDRWAKLCKGLLIRQKLERKYNYNFSKTTTTTSNTTTSKKTKK